MIVILHNIRSAENVGSIFRTADAIGAEKIYLLGYTPAPIDEFGRQRQKLIKASLGAEKFIPWKKIKSVKPLITKIKKEGYKIFAIEQDKKSIPYYRLKTKNSRLKTTALILGNEVKGLPYSILKLSDKILEIPMLGKKESLNVAVAFGIVAFHLKYSVMRP